MKKGFYKTGVAVGLIFDTYLLVALAMIQAKSANITAFAIFSALIPFVAGIGCTIWFVAFVARSIMKEVSIKNYKLPLALTSIAVVIALFMFARVGYYV